MPRAVVVHINVSGGSKTEELDTTLLDGFPKACAPESTRNPTGTRVTLRLASMCYRTSVSSPLLPQLTKNEMKEKSNPTA